MIQSKVFQVKKSIKAQEEKHTESNVKAEKVKHTILQFCAWLKSCWSHNVGCKRLEDAGFYGFVNFSTSGDIFVLNIVTDRDQCGLHGKLFFVLGLPRALRYSRCLCLYQHNFRNHLFYFLVLLSYSVYILTYEDTNLGVSDDNM